MKLDLKALIEKLTQVNSKTLILDKTATGTYPVSDISQFRYLLFVGGNSDFSTVLVTSYVPFDEFSQVRMTWTVNGSTATLDTVIDKMSNTSIKISSLTSSRRIKIYGIK